MNTPVPPFLELGFYFAQHPETVAFRRLVEALVGMGAKFTGSATAHRGEGLRDQPFASISDLALEPIAVRSLADLERSLNDLDLRLLQVYLEGASGVTQGVSEIVGYQSISEEAKSEDHHPVAIWTDGVLFSGTFRQQRAARALEVGRQSYERFHRLIEVLKPSYAAITLEYDLECPADLRRDARSLAFRNFFVSGSYLGADNLKRIADLFRGAYIDTAVDGLYISCTPEFNPHGSGLDKESAQWKSAEVAQLIAAARSTSSERSQ